MDIDPINSAPQINRAIQNGLSIKKGETLEEQKEAAKLFESYFVYTLFKEMQKTVPKGGGLFGEGAGGGVYEHLFNQAIADNVAERGGLGLSKMLMDDFQQKENRLRRTNEQNGGADATIKPLDSVRKTVRP